jgi:hypothetical protein
VGSRGESWCALRGVGAAQCAGGRSAAGRGGGLAQAAGAPRVGSAAARVHGWMPSAASNFEPVAHQGLLATRVPQLTGAATRTSADVSSWLVPLSRDVATNGGNCSVWLLPRGGDTEKEHEARSTPASSHKWLACSGAFERSSQAPGLRGQGWTSRSPWRRCSAEIGWKREFAVLESFDTHGAAAVVSCSAPFCYSFPAIVPLLRSEEVLP